MQNACAFMNCGPNPTRVERLHVAVSQIQGSPLKYLFLEGSGRNKYP